MKIFLPFTVKDIGGPSTFARKFQEGVRAHDHEVFFKYRSDYDILLLIVQSPFRYLLEAKQRKKPIIQRLDGTYYWSVAGWKYPFLNLKATIIRHYFTNFSIYQSEYSKYCAERFLGKKQNEQSTIIYNGVDRDLFSPTGTKEALRDNPNQHIFFTASAFRREDQIVPLLEALKIYQKIYTDKFKFFIAGTFTEKLSHIPKQYAGFQNVHFLGKIENQELPTYERSADVFLFSHLNPPCPNNIIEAMACGLPICGVADGAMPELVRHGEDGLLLPIKEDAFQKTRKINVRKFADNLHYIMSQKEKYGAAAVQNVRDRFSLDTMLTQYLTVLKHLA